MRVFTLAIVFAVINFTAGCESSSGIADSNKSLRSEGGNNGFNSSSMSDEDKYKLFYAASKSGDGSLVLEVSRKIGINDADNQPTSDYVNFWKGYIDWTSKDKSFIKTLDTPEKAKDYVNSRLR